MRSLALQPYDTISLLDYERGQGGREEKECGTPPPVLTSSLPSLDPLPNPLFP